MRRSSGLLLLLLPLAACAAVDPRPVAAFSSSVRQLARGTDRAFRADRGPAEERFVREAVAAAEAGDPSRLERLRLAVDPRNPFAPGTERSPAFLRGEGMDEGARRAAEALRTYAELLSRLADPDLLSPGTFDRAASGLNAGIAAAARRLAGKDSPPPSAALFSAAAAEAARRYLAGGRTSDLEAALRSNQGTVESFAALMRRAVRIEAARAAQEYDEESQRLLRRTVTGRGPAREATVRAAARALLALDHRHLARLAALRSLDRAYAELPGAHAELLRAMRAPGAGLPAILALGDRAARVLDDAERAAREAGR